jgi:hypothetical protein
MIHDGRVILERGGKMADPTVGEVIAKYFETEDEIKRISEETGRS